MRVFQQDTQCTRFPNQGDLTYWATRLNLPHLSASVTLQQYAAFWPWFESCMYIVLKARSMWNRVPPASPALLIYGFVPKADSTAALHGKLTGTFIIRFSDSQLRNFAIAYVEQAPDGRPFIDNFLVGTLPQSLSLCHACIFCLLSFATLFLCETYDPAQNAWIKGSKSCCKMAPGQSCAHIPHWKN
jgi:hypothetical protein